MDLKREFELMLTRRQFFGLAGKAGHLGIGVAALASLAGQNLFAAAVAGDSSGTQRRAGWSACLTSRQRPNA